MKGTVVINNVTLGVGSDELGEKLMGSFLRKLWVATALLLGSLSVLGCVGCFAPAAFAAATDQTFPAVAFDGTNYMVVWQDGRTGTYPDIYGARVTTAGIVIEPNGIAISTATNQQSSPAVAFDGSNYMVVWQDMRNSSYYQIYGARVTTSGAVLDPGGILICTVSSNRLAPAIGFDGTNYMVVWQDLRSGSSDIYAARVSKTGTVLDPGGIAVTTAPNLQAYPAIAFDGTNYMVVWHDERNSSHYDLYGARVSKAGVVLDASGIAISTLAKRQGFPAIAFDGTNYMVVWQDDRSGFYDIYCSRISPSGAVLDAGGIAVSTATSDQSYPAIAFGGTNYMVVWQDYRAGYFYDIYGSRLSKSAAVLDPAGIALSTAANSQLAPAIAFDGTDFFAIWQDARAGSYDIYGTRVTASGVVLDPSGLTDIAFTSASAKIEDGCVALSWQMAVDVPSSSFVVMRADSPDGEFQTADVAVHQESALSFSCTDCGVQPGRSYWYEIMLVSQSGDESFGPIEAKIGTTPVTYKVHQSYPNPFNPVCTIRYEIPRAGKVNLQVFDVSGVLVRNLVDGWCEAGVYSETWNGRSDDGSALPSGVYFYSVKAGEFAVTRKLVLLR
jgi:hypothetical protein